MQKKIFIAFVFLIILLSSILGFYSVNIHRDYYTEDYKQHLIKETKMLSIILKTGYDLNQKELYLKNFVDQYAREFECRITVIEQSGLVLADSDALTEEMDNHGTREEIVKAMEGKEGVSLRYSPSMKTQFIYSALQVPLEGENLIIRIAVPLTELETIKNQVIVTILGGILFAAFFAFLIAFYIAGKMAEPLDNLTRGVEEISKGCFGKQIPIDSEDQVGFLTKAFNKMSRDLNVTVDQLEEENSKLESIVNSMLNGLIAINNENKIMMINDVSYRLFHIGINDIIGYHFYDIIRNEDVYQTLNQSIETQDHVIHEFILKEPLEGDKTIRIYATPILRKGQEKKIMGTLLVFQDVTQIRKLEQLRSDFVSNVTHELKTPLTSIMGFTDTLKSGAIYDTESALRFIDIIEIESQRLYRLIQDILSLSEMETRKKDTNMMQYPFGEIVNYVYPILLPAAKEKGISFYFDLQKNLPLFYCNKDRISQMLINLIDNAIKYTESGEVSVFCSQKGNDLEIIVKDTGIGIPKEYQTRIFERFYRVDKGRSRKAGGTGLGLSIVKHIVMLYNGTIQLDSQEGKGSAFTIHLPSQKEKNE